MCNDSKYYVHNIIIRTLAQIKYSYDPLELERDLIHDLIQRRIRSSKITFIFFYEDQIMLDHLTFAFLLLYTIMLDIFCVK